MLLLPVVLACLLAQQSGATFLSQTTEFHSMSNSNQLCPDSDKDLKRTGVANFTEYSRRHKLAHSAHKKVLLDHAEPSKNQHIGILDKIYDYPLLVPSLAVQQGISNLGETSRLETFINKLIQGKPVKIGALGGSVTVGHNVQNKQTAWLYRVFDWVNATFPHPQHEFINNAIPAVTSAYVAPCVLNILPHDLDLVFLEFTFNDGEKEKSQTDIADPTRIGLERLIRKLLSLDSRPAILNLHYHPFLVKNYKNYWFGSEDSMEMLFRYYGIPSISFRSGMHHLLSDQEWLIPKIWFHDDPVHPTCVGHKFIADLAIGVLQDLSAHMISTSCCHTQHNSSLTKLYNELPPPMLSGILTLKQVDSCFFGEDFKRLENGKEGYNWVNEGRKPGQFKYGFVSWKPGDNIVIKVPVEDIMPYMENRTALVALGVMESYQHMGYLTFSCVNGCSCKTRRVNSHNPSPYSLTYWKGASVTIDEGSEHCELFVQSLEKSRSGEYKTKITSLLVSSDPSSFIESWSDDN